MNCKFIPFKISFKDWNSSIEKMDGHTHLYSPNLIEYYYAFNKIENCSFLVENDNTLVAAVVLAINKSEKFLFYGYDFGCALHQYFKEIETISKRKFLKLIINYIQSLNKKFTDINFFNHPVITSGGKPEIKTKNQFELLQFSKKFSYKYIYNRFELNN